MQDPNQLDARRPLKVRGNQLSKNCAKWLSQKSITPNQISVLSIVFALFSGFCFIMSIHNLAYRPCWMIAAALFIQARLLCNLFDGMVAIEGGKSTASGELFNDIPDRISDPIIIIAAGYSILCVSWGETLGWLAALLAVLTAYVRTLAVSIGAPSNFTGPMAKQQRMALLTVSCILVAIEYYFWQQDYAMLIALILMNFGCIWTLLRRTSAAYQYLEKAN
ncbi:CDP-alcohol phosphatidyltransferase family protein [Acinetobacter sp. ANC 4648]|uniref:CDP-alcohol phosphatidyltransferase family protein n=1 Tax=Acinetobacter sp. ANC 4648 TaxID=1977875 RepID=UPI000A359D87|nr:CDP-alcohol phosphatidyltransferase family protein [Acinetobacter sp. ANC 4648]OTG80735.1 CDP-diacylglycerol--glycerol-3-phosphate 3-phosphatidyltransferase [Acinetobacter sp. ANC 4648]